MSTARKVLITPALAAEWLQHNAGNRPVRRAHVSFLANEIVSGRWKDNGDTIKRGENGRLLDGQHRLMAVTQAKKPVQMWVVEDLANETFVTIDTNRYARSVGQVFALAGHKNANATASVVRAAMVVLECRWSGENKALNTRFSAEHMDAFLSSHACVRAILAEFVSAGTKGRAAAGVTGSVAGALAAVAEINPHRTEEIVSFLRRLLSGAGLDEGSAALLLRNRLAGFRGQHNRTSQEYQMAITIKAVVAALQNRPLMLLRWTDAESFPAAPVL